LYSLRIIVQVLVDLIKKGTDYAALNASIAIKRRVGPLIKRQSRRPGRLVKSAQARTRP
jgi:hypothetical protein